MNKNSSNNILDGGNPSSIESPVIPQFSYFNAPITNVYPDKIITIQDAFEEIIDIRKQGITALLRTIDCVGKARAFKAQNFPYCTFAGIFSKRNDQSLIKASSLIVLDYDHITDITELKRLLLEDRYFETELLFISPSGTGLKWIVKINLEEDSHLNWFNATTAYVKETYNLEIDPSGKDLSRACFLCYDPHAYIRPKDAISNREKFNPADWLPNQENSKDLFTPRAKIEENEFLESSDQESNPDVELIIERIEAAQIDITSDYRSWLKAGFAFANTYGEAGREAYHRVSQFYRNYSKTETDRQFDRCLKTPGIRTNISTIYYLAQENGINIY